MGYKTKVQVIKRARTQQWYICFPSALAQAMEFSKSEEVEWVIESEGKLVLKREVQKKKPRSSRDKGRRKR